MQTEQIPVLKADEYPGGIWYYEPHTYQPYRYVRGPRWHPPAGMHWHQPQHRPARRTGPHP